LEEMAARAAAPLRALVLCETTVTAASCRCAAAARSHEAAASLASGSGGEAAIANFAAARVPFACRYFRVAVLGDASYGGGVGEARAAAAVALGGALTVAGYVVVTGGLGGAMEAASRGAAAAACAAGAARARNRSDVEIWTRGPPPSGPLGILPGPDHPANPYVGAAVHTGIGHARNSIVAATADAAVIVGGGAGTMAEAAAAWTAGRLLVAIAGTGGTADLLAGRRLDNRRRLHGVGAYAVPLDEDYVFAARDAAHAVAIIDERIHWYRLESLRRAKAASSAVAAGSW
jgi:predicted Rossmann-fold nucleotide-binding protein